MLFGSMFLLIIAIAVFVPVARAAVVINEACVNCIPQAVELYNTASSEADITGWYLDDNGGTTYITLGDMILPPNRCYVVEGSLNLNKSSPDSVRLFSSEAPPTSASAMLVDIYTYKSIPGMGKTFSRMPDGQDWATSEASLGYFNENGLSCLADPTPSPSPVPTLFPSPGLTPVSTPLPIIQPSSFSNIYISEIMPYPETGEPEWVELYNGNDFAVDLGGWYVDDAELAGSAPKKIEITIGPQEYAAVEMTTSMFNNDGDVVRLLDADKKEVDAVEFGPARLNKSCHRILFGEADMCLGSPTKNAANGSCAEPSSSPVRPTRLPTISLIATPPRLMVARAPGQQPVTASYQPFPTGTVLGSTTSIASPAETRDSPCRQLALLSVSYSSLGFWSFLIKLKRSLSVL